MRKLSRWLIALLVLLGAASVVALLRPGRVVVDVAPVARGPFELVVEEDGKTRVRERYLVSAPVYGRLLRIELEEGDAVERGDLLAAIVPTAPPLLDSRSRQEIRERVAAAEAALDRAVASLARARLAAAEATSDLDRARRLSAEGVVAAKELERQQFAADSRAKEVAAAEFEQEVVRHELEMTRAALSQLREDTHGVEPWEIRSPVPGRVLRVLNESEGVVAAGAPLVELADAADLEVVVDLLTSDAVRTEPGADVLIEGWGGAPLEGRVLHVEPGAFTKISALGVEEQRVNVVIEIVSPRARYRALGDGYRLDARITLQSLDDALLVPSGALFRDRQGFAAYVVEDGRARKRAVAIGGRNQLAATVEQGLAEGERVVVYPPDELSDGARVAERATGTAPDVAPPG